MLRRNHSRFFYEILTNKLKCLVVVETYVAYLFKRCRYEDNVDTESAVHCRH